MIGSGRGVGTTHLAVWTANYLTGVRRERVALLEWNDHGDFARIRQFCGKTGIAGKGFRILEVDYYERADASVFASCLSDTYQHIIVDYGEITEAALCECARCDRKVMIGSYSEWQAEAFLESVGRERKQDKSWTIAAAFGSEETRREWEKAFHRTCLRIPTSADAFAVRGTDLKFFERLF